VRKEKIAVMFGGRSSEHEISVISALQSIRAIDSLKYEVFPIYLALNGKWYTGAPLFQKEFYKKIPESYSTVQEITLMPNSVGSFTILPSQKKLPIDICFLAFHGQYGEDGCVQGLLELADIPYTGSSISSSAVAMNKFQSKSIVLAHGIPTLPSVLATKKDSIRHLPQVQNKILNALQFPLFVKPNHLGSSVGISKANDISQLNAALAKVFQYDDQALVEPCLEKLLEINVAVLDGNPPIASVVEIPIATAGALSYEDKYLRGGSKSTGGQSSGMAGLSRIIDPVDLKTTIKEEVIALALHSFELLDCSGVCRFDFMYDLQKEKLYFNEVNPIPGSFSFYLWDKAKPRILYTELIDRLLTSAKERKSMQRSLNREFGFYAL
jgi:D-alanine-D-alanine ligase